MKKFIYLWTGLLMLCTTAYAYPSGAAAPDAGAGKRRAAVCFSCHTAEGISNIPGVPHLAGQERSYLEKVLHSYREGQQRQDPTMTAMVKPLSDADIVNISAYFSLLPRGANAACDHSKEVTAGATPAAATATTIAPVAAKQHRSGKTVYQEACMACHSSGAAGAPKLGDKNAWRPKIAQGSNTLLQHALHGYNAMPAQGGCTACTESEIKAAVDYLVAQGK
jgi:cytochrome c5